MTKRVIDISWHECQNWSHPLAWHRSGFKDYDDLKQQTRELPLEKKVDMLTEIFMSDMAKSHFIEKRDFLSKLGHKTYVGRDEVYEYAVSTFTECDGAVFKVNNHDFHGVWIDTRSMQADNVHAHQLDAAGIDHKRAWDIVKEQQ